MIIKEVLTGFLDAYLVRRDLEDAASFLSDNVVGLGIGVGQTALNREQLRSLMLEELRSVPGGFRYHIHDYYENRYREDLYGVYCRFCAASMAGSEAAFQARLTATASRSGDEWKFLQVHMSILPEERHRGEFSSIKYGRRAVGKLDMTGSRKLAEMMLSMLPGGILGVYLEDGFPLYLISDTMLGYLGYTYEELVEETGEEMQRIIAPEDWDRVQKAIYGGLEEMGGYDVQYRVICRNGSRMWIDGKGHAITTEDGRRAVISVMLDINENIRLQERLQREVMEDSLTGILNRKGAIAHIESYMRNKKPGSMFLLDIDNFKQLNDTYGHQTGDQVLILLASIMRSCSRERDVAARIGGDEFVLFLPGCVREEILKERADRICSEFRRAGSSYDRVELSVSIGIAVSDGTSGFDQLFKMADDQLYQAKKSGKGKFQYQNSVGI